MAFAFYWLFIQWISIILNLRETYLDSLLFKGFLSYAKTWIIIYKWNFWFFFLEYFNYREIIFRARLWYRSWYRIAGTIELWHSVTYFLVAILVFSRVWKLVGLRTGSRMGIVNITIITLLKRRYCTKKIILFID